MQKSPLLSFQNVSYSYDEEAKPLKFAVEDVTFTVEQGEIVAVLGHNGSGKSTLAKLSNSIYIPTKGQVFINGMDTSLPENELTARKTVGVVFQNPDNQIVASIVEEDVAFGPENLGLSPAEIRLRVDEALKAVGMYEYRMRETHKLSGGQKQRVAIAGILAMRPKAIVLDEPTAMLDPKGREDVMNALFSLRERFGMTVVIITHFMEEAVLCDRVLIMHRSHLKANGTPKEIFAQEQLLLECGLELTETEKLTKLLRQKEIKLPEHLLTPAEFTEEFYKLFSKQHK